MAIGKLEEFVAYQKALELFDNVVQDVTQLLQNRMLERLISQQLASADSVCANIEEGYGRQSTIEYRAFLSSPADHYVRHKAATDDFATGYLRTSSTSALYSLKKSTAS
jgi:hypothetical protein